MQMNQSPTRTSFPLSENKIIKKTVVGSLGALLLYIFIIVFSLSIPQVRDQVGIVIIIALLIFFLHIIVIYIYQYYYFLLYYYDLTENFVVIRKGVFANREITIPYLRIQDVYVDQDIFDRLFGLYDVHLSSATVTSGFEAHIDGLSNNGAQGIKTLLLQKLQSIRMQKNPQTASTVLNTGLNTNIPTPPVPTPTQ